MSVAELKREIDGLSVEQIEDLAAYIQMRMLESDPEFQSEMQRRIQKMEQRDGIVSKEEVLRWHHENLSRDE